MDWFTKWEYINWTRLWSIVGVFTVFWSAMTGITFIWPALDTPFKIINIILGAITLALVFAARSSVYIVNRQPPPADGKP